MATSSSAQADHRGYRHPFLLGAHYLGGVGDEPRTLVELAMCQFSASIRSTEKWWIEFRDDKFRDHWLMYAKNRPWIIHTASGRAEVLLSDKQIKYILDELEGYAALRNDAWGCQVSCFERIWQSDAPLDPSVTVQLVEGLEKIVPSSYDGIQKSVIDPTLYCLVYNKTLVSHKNGKIYCAVPPAPSQYHGPNFALLPSEVSVPLDGSAVRFVSYINNLHPDSHKSLYSLLETLLTRFIPLFEHSLTDLHRNNPIRLRIPGACKYTVWEEPEQPEHSDDEEGWNEYRKRHRQWSINRPLNLPDVPFGGYPGGLEARRHKVSLRGHTIQVVVRTLTIALDSKNHTSFPGLPWHVEGTKNERIVASGIYCLSNAKDNIIEPVAQFRMAVTYPRGFSAGDEGATLRTWGLANGDPCHQYIGEVKLLTGRSLVFPNIYQYALKPIKLRDPSRKGHLNLIFFHLIDPETRPVISTSVVSPQQEEWISAVVYQALRTRLPTELIEQVVQNIEGLLTAGEAGMHREDFFAMQKQFSEANNRDYFCIPFDVWQGPHVLPH
ncbi:hypothetical protein CVT24_001048 [Panaeolus cyanescens]|uniref:DUF4246 domain-containing protein n=1 Tax=Panaeolus cyanescens TaxID=181874 RepID=A0A409W796_9AGAR|nr:hypothetical protein CVT24_001048 [Panaeolus cyanescens]